MLSKSAVLCHGTVRTNHMYACELSCKVSVLVGLYPDLNITDTAFRSSQSITKTRPVGA